mmetsp:Transcript_11454/g.40741  ORF Transcript_11454/g.40741 Transcript_11454/m.40741 type:complete len:402 (-) Transcript_11454:112-1317(-)|eukprot:CAMPEP_0203952422 /NCGR_PEP_ID=MMETSP0359-20131031/86072_1 /ASSEMBLY_ACC=CAM_ASM_000338 /TAXON_ID=268821 /ORGANISM="Scrippsiella Hangoei, Strain SHTV-5" /LENGTH=401 /DNA_ID=CAMNT_0050885409 /DNA_START=38 /DNA_END=1243 /DNA_ORIENTATION=+
MKFSRASELLLTVGNDGKPDWLEGVLLCLVGSTFTGLGLVLIRYSLEKNASSSKPLVFHKQPWWILGVGIFFGGQLLNFVAMGMAPQVILSGLGVWSMVANAFFAKLIVDERLNLLGMMMMFCSCVGVVAVLIGTPSSTSHSFTGDLQTMREAFAGRMFLQTTAVLLTVLALVWAVARQRPRLNLGSLAWALSSAVVSGYTVMLFKCVSLLAIEPAPSKPSPWTQPEAYCILAAAALAGFLQFSAMNLALNERDGEALVVFPVAYTLGMLIQILMGEVVFKELEAFKSARQLCFFWGGTIFLLLCIVLHMEAKLALIQNLLAEVEKEIEGGGIETLDDLPASPAWRRRAGMLQLGRQKSSDSDASLASMVSGPFDPHAYPESFGEWNRFYTVSIMGPIGIA